MKTRRGEGLVFGKEKEGKGDAQVRGVGVRRLVCWVEEEQRMGFVGVVFSKRLQTTEFPRNFCFCSCLFHFLTFSLCRKGNERRNGSFPVAGSIFAPPFSPAFSTTNANARGRESLLDPTRGCPPHRVEGPRLGSSYRNRLKGAAI